MYTDFLLSNQVDFIFSKLGADNCYIDRGTVLLLYTMIYTRRPKNLLEIGRYQGASTACICGALKDLEHGRLYSIDVLNQYPQWIETYFYDNEILIADSLKILDHPVLSKIKYDLFFIDGDHNYNSVLQDLENTYILSNQNALWIIDDYEFPDIKKSVNEWLGNHSDLQDLGVFNHKVKMILQKS